MIISQKDLAKKLYEQKISSNFNFSIMNDTIYPPSVEEKLKHIVESSKEIRFEDDIKLNENCVREAFGKVLFDNWLAGNEEFEMSIDEILNLYTKAAALTVVHNLLNEGYIDSIEDEDGREMVFVTQKGKDLMSNGNTQKNEKGKKRKKSGRA